MVAMRSPIPKDIRHELSYDPYMRECIIKDGQCDGRIEWNHAFSYSGKRQSSIWCILPMCTFHHRTEATYREEIRDQLRYRLLYFGLEAKAAAKYPKSDLFSLPEKKKGGKSVSPLSNNGDVASVVKRVDISS